MGRPKKITNFNLRKSVFIDNPLKEAVRDFDEEHDVERIILIGKDDAIRQIILGEEE